MKQLKDGRKNMEKKIYKYKELMHLYTNAMEIIDQLSMNAEQQIQQLKDTAVTDEIALDFCESAKCYIEILGETIGLIKNVITLY